MAGLTALKVCTSAVTASFRYPRVQIGKLPTFDMPPPATIYGHIASAVGEWFAPGDLKFSYVFQHSGKALDLETIHPIESGPGKPTLKKRGWIYPVNVQCEPNVQRREFLLRPHMTLYLSSQDLALLERIGDAFRNSVYAMLLGRSQDLAWCESISTVHLTMSDSVFFADTLVPFEWRPWVSPGTTVALPAAIDYLRKRMAIQERYLQISKAKLSICKDTDDVLDRTKLPADFVSDPQDKMRVGSVELSRGLWFWPVRGPSGVE